MKTEREDIYDPGCNRCSRLVQFLAEVKAQYPEYACMPVPPFGDADARLLIVGLAPGKHGANASGRPFTGDHAGILLYNTLYKFGFANQPYSSDVNDNLKLRNCRITNAVKCLPPGNKPIGSEVANCNSYLKNELRYLPASSVVLALGGVSHRAILKTLNLRQAHYPFFHGKNYLLPNDLCLLSSYHCSRYNTQTRRLTTPMFEDVFKTARNLLNNG